MTDSKSYLWIPTVLIYLASCYLSSKLIGAVFPEVSLSFVFLIAMTFVGLLYYLPACRFLPRKGLIYFFSRFIILCLFVLSVGSSVGGINAYFMKANSTLKQDKNIQDLIDKSHRVIASRDSVQNLSQNMWYQYNNQQKQEANVAGLTSLLQSDTYLTNKKDMESVGYLYSLCNQISTISGIQYSHVQLGVTAIIAFLLDGLGVLLVLTILGSNKLGAKFGFKHKSRYMTIEQYAKWLWKNVNSKFWQDSHLYPLNKIPIKKSLEVKYRSLFLTNSMMTIKNYITYPLCDKDTFMKMAHLLEQAWNEQHHKKRDKKDV